MNFFLLFCVVVISFVSPSEQKSKPKIKVTKKTEKTCRPTVKLFDCLSTKRTVTTEGYNWKWRRYLQYEITAEATIDCNPRKLSLKWYFKDSKIDLSEYNDKARLVLKSYRLETGDYILNFAATALFRSGKQTVSTASCKINIVEEDPEPTIFGGTSLYVPPGKEIMILGENSRNRNLPPWKKNILEYKWSCNISGITRFSTQFCRNKIYKDMNLKVDANYVSDGAIFYFKLAVSANKGKNWFSAIQRVTVKKGAFGLKIKCIYNCVGTVSDKASVQLQAVCPDCPDFYQNLEWSCTLVKGKNKKFDVNNLDHTSTGPYTYRMIIKEQKLAAGQTYDFKVKYKGQMIEESAVYRLVLINALSQPKCTVQPKSGFALKTKFRFNCPNMSSSLKTSMIFILKLIRDYSTTWVSKKNYFNIHLPYDESIHYIILIYDAKGQFTIQTMTITLSPCFTSSEQIWKALDYGYEVFQSPATLLKYQKVMHALLFLNALGSEAQILMMDSDELLDFEARLIALYSSIKIECQSDVFLFVSCLMRTLRYDDVERCSGFLDSVQRLADIQYDFVLKTLDRAMWAGRNQILARSLHNLTSKCLKRTGAELGVEQTKLKHIATNSTGGEIAEPSFMREDYPDYEDYDTTYNRKLTFYVSNLNRMMVISRLCAQIHLLSMDPGAPLENFDTDSYDTYLMKDKATSLSRRMLGDEDCQVYGGDALRTYGYATVSAVISMFKFSPFFWSKLSSHLLTDIEFRVKEQIVTKFEKRMDIYFKRPEIINGISSLRRRNKLTLRKGDSSKGFTFNVYRVLIRSGAALILEMYLKARYQIVVLHNKHPVQADFHRAGRYVDSTDRNITVLFPEKEMKFGNAWVYVGIRENANDTGELNMITSATACLFWEPKLRKWKTSQCVSGNGSSITTIHCKCDVTGTYTYESTKRNYKYIEHLKPLFKLQISINYVIFRYLLLLFGLYLISMVIVIKNQRPEKEEVYFLADNNVSHLYAYLVIVKTGYAGTTSNVSIKIFGKLHKDKSHVLNFPDPEMALLQRNGEDCFVVSTQHYLGDIQKIYLWHDSVGLNPSWYCKWIRIVDLQSAESKEWHFQVNKEFSVLRTIVNYIEVPFIKGKGVGRIQGRLEALLCHHSWNFRRSRYRKENIFNVERCTVHFSSLLSSLLLVSILHGIPRFDLTDGLGLGHFQLPLKLMGIGILVSFLICCLNIMTIRVLKKRYLKLIGLAFTISIILVSTTAMIIFASRYQKNTALALVVVSLIAVALSAVVVEPLYLYLNFWNVDTNMPKVRVSNVFIAKQIEQQRRELYPIFGNSLLQPYLREKYRPLSREEWKLKYQIERRRTEITGMIYDFITYVIYLVILFYVIFANKDQSNVYGYLNMKDMVEGLHLRNKAQLGNVRSIDQFYTYLENTFFPVIYTNTWYDGYNLKNPGILSDVTTKILGAVAIRQQRVNEINCKEIVMNVLNVKDFNCHLEFSRSIQETGNFGSNWTTENILKSSIGRHQPWTYSYASTSTVGYLNTYPQGGYFASLGRTAFNSRASLFYLNSTNWVDKKTRMVALEFLAYNNDANIFHAVKLIVEQSSTDLVVVSTSIYTTRFMIMDSKSLGAFIVLCTALLPMVAIMLYRSYSNARGDWRLCMKNFWNVIDVLIALLTFVFIILYCWRVHLVISFMEKMQTTKHNQVIDHQSLFSLEMIVHIIAALLTCISTVRLWKLLHIGNIFRVMEKTVEDVWGSLSAVILYHAIFLLLYSLMGSLTFGDQFEEFRDVTQSLMSLVLIAINTHKNFNYEMVYEGHGIFGYVFYASYILMTWSTTVFYMAIIMHSFNKTRKKFSNQRDYYPVSRYAKDLRNFKMELLKKDAERLRGGHDGVKTVIIESKVHNKANGYRYAKAVLVPTTKIRLMEAITRSVLENRYGDSADHRDTKKRKKHRAKLLDDIVICHLMIKDKPFEDRDHEIGFTCGPNHLNIKIVLDTTLLKMRCILDNVVNQTTIAQSKVMRFDADDRENRKYVLAKSRKPDDNDTEKRLRRIKKTLKAILIVVNNIDVY